MANSPVFGMTFVETSDKVYKHNNRALASAVLLSGVTPLSRISPYTFRVINLAAERYSSLGVRLSPSSLAFAVRALELDSGSRSFKDAESIVKECASSVSAKQPTEQEVVDCAVALTIGDIASEYSEDFTKKYTSTEAANKLCKRLSDLGVECFCAGSPEKVYTPPITPSITPTQSINSAQTKQALSGLSGSKQKPLKSLVYLMVAENSINSNLSGIYPVVYPKDIYKSALGLDGAEKPAEPAEKDTWTDVLMSFTKSAAGASVNLLEKYGESKISQADKEAQLYILSEYKKATGKPGASESEIAAFVSSNPSVATNAVSSAYGSQGISKEDILALINAQKKPEPNYPVIAAVALAGTLLIGGAVYALSQIGKRNAN